MSRRAYVLIKTEKGESSTAAAELSGKHGVLVLDLVFGQYDLIASIEADDVEGLAKIVRNGIAAAEHVSRTETLIVASAMKPNPDV